MKRWVVLMSCIAAGLMLWPLNGLAEESRLLTLVYTGDIDGKIDPIPQ